MSGYTGSRSFQFNLQDVSRARRSLTNLPCHNQITLLERKSERLAKRYWDKLFKEYCLVDLSRFKENKVNSLAGAFNVQLDQTVVYVVGKRRDVTRRSAQSTDSCRQSTTEHSDNSQAEQTDDSSESSATKRAKRSPTDSMNQTSIWRDPRQCRGVQSNAPRTQEEEFDEYFADMLL
ncbi:uncharacterized protein DEA37_0011700 [Paragonimus westermani]|uniref:Uncharacterized protein n=1 Tax=Paragonimus westermani TaxID=34504 RepID=A0A5J4NWS7_9TREM|nr:uncharacterized protein DEA37_0011700 [Paragonimus westermani]